MVFYLPGVVPGRKLVTIALQMLRADLVEDAKDPPFQQGPEVFDTVGMKTSVHVLAYLVVYHNMLELVILPQVGIHSVSICYHSAAFGHVFVDQFGGSLLAHPIRHLYDNLSVRLNDAEYRGFNVATAIQPLATLLLLDLSNLALMLVADLSSYICFINLGSTTQHLRGLIFKLFAKAMKNKPRRFLRDAQLAVKLQAGNALLARQTQIASGEPIAQRNLAVLIDRPNLNCELLATSLIAAFKAPIRAVWINDPTERASGRTTPPLMLQVRNTYLLICEVIEAFGEVLEVHYSFICPR